VSGLERARFADSSPSKLLYGTFRFPLPLRRWRFDWLQCSPRHDCSEHYYTIVVQSARHACFASSARPRSNRPNAEEHRDIFAILSDPSQHSGNYRPRNLPLPYPQSAFSSKLGAIVSWFGHQRSLALPSSLSRCQIGSIYN